MTETDNNAGNGMIVPVILSGGAGTRLWPMSHDDRPKQFLPLTGPVSLYRAALDRVRGQEGFAPPLVVAGRRHADLCAAELGGDAALILEPMARNTAPAIALAAIEVAARHGGDAMLLVMPSDHVIADPAAFIAAARRGAAAAADGALVTFGITPDAPETGYGYLEMGAALPHADGVHAVARFVEKPPLADAQAMLAGGRHLWNAGIFLFRADAYLAALDAHAPAMAAACSAAMAAALRDGAQILPDADAMAGCPSDSIDYAVMERAERVAVVPMSPGWSDVGSWDALAAILPADADGNSAVGPVTLVDANGNHVHADGVEVAMLGVSDLIVVASNGKLLIMPKGRSQEVKALLAAMKTPD